LARKKLHRGVDTVDTETIPVGVPLVAGVTVALNVSASSLPTRTVAEGDSASFVVVGCWARTVSVVVWAVVEPAKFALPLKLAVSGRCRAVVDSRSACRSSLR
jgi:hypothetical protein